MISPHQDEKEEKQEWIETCDQYNRCWLASACVCARRGGGKAGREVVRHTGNSATEDVKLLNLFTLLVTVIVDDPASEVSTTVGDSCGSLAVFRDN